MKKWVVAMPLLFCAIVLNLGCAAPDVESIVRETITQIEGSSSESSYIPEKSFEDYYEEATKRLETETQEQYDDMSRNDEDSELNQIIWGEWTYTYDGHQYRLAFYEDRSVEINWNQKEDYGYAIQDNVITVYKADPTIIWRIYILTLGEDGRLYDQITKDSGDTQYIFEKAEET
ncbi:MAG TPA: hypothetical protein DEB31_03050 [Clostridiales bacterium]|nr:hypothetical protein [Clostridiales bacterium]